MKVEALIFDVDGTLVDTEEVHRQAYNQTFARFRFGLGMGRLIYTWSC